MQKIKGKHESVQAVERTQSAIGDPWFIVKSEFSNARKSAIFLAVTSKINRVPNINIVITYVKNKKHT